jgi:hypothetical protein
MTDAAFSLDKTVLQELGVVGNGAEGLRCLLLLDIAILPETPEDVLDDLCLLGSGCPAENIKVDSEPVVDSFVNSVVFRTELRGSYALLQCLGLRSGSIFILRFLSVFCTKFRRKINHEPSHR